MQRGSSTILRISPASVARENTATRNQRPVERIQVDEKQGKRFEKTSKGIERWKDRDRRAGGIEERKETGGWGWRGVRHGDFTTRKAVQVVVRLEAGQMHLAFYQDPPEVHLTSLARTFFFISTRSDGHAHLGQSRMNLHSRS